MESFKILVAKITSVLKDSNLKASEDKNNAASMDPQ
jgi:hypothetical protein